MHSYFKTEIELLNELRAANPAAIQAWYAQYHKDILYFVSSKIGDERDAEELCHEVFINSLRQLSLFKGQSSLKTWMLSIARHEVADYFRKKYAKRVLHTTPLGELIPDQRYTGEEMTERVRAALGKLPREQQELLQLKYVDRKQVSEIAVEIGKTIKAVESDLFRARQAFKIAFVSTADPAERWA